MTASLPNDSGYFELLTKGIYLERISSKLSKELCIFQVDNDGISLKYHKVPGFKWMKQDDCAKRNILISNIKEIRKGAQTDRFAEAFKHHEKHRLDNCCLSLVLNEGKTIDLIANREDVRDAFLECMSYLKNRQASYNLHEMKNLWYREQFLKADKNNDGELSVPEIVKLLNHLNIDVDEFYVVFLLQKEKLNMNEFVDLIRKLQARKTIDELFKKYSCGRNYLDIGDLHNLLSKEQNESLSLAECDKIIETYEEWQEFKTRKCLTMDGFYKFLTSPYFDIFNSKYSAVYQDMNQPITSYFVDSSHNTYLEGDQFNSYSRVECYVNALSSGCRCVEIDVWDGKSDPVVHHGYANTTKVSFSNVINAIDEYAFVRSRYPVILSIENHCSVEQQKKMAKIMKETFGEKLFAGPVSEDGGPTPEQLIGKIIIKCRKLDSSRSSVSNPPDPLDEVLHDFEFDYNDAGVKTNSYKIAKELSDLAVICQAVKFTSFQHSSINHNFAHICSFDEKKALALSHSNFKEFVVHNTRVMTRVYPSGTRIKSSNYDPFPLWMAGCQIVALNYQTPSQPMFLNKGMFSDNGGCGYVLKPELQRNIGKLDEFVSAPGLLGEKAQIHLKIIDGFSLPKKPKDCDTSILDPYVQVKIIGVSQDCYSFKTETIKNNGFNPAWNNEFTFSLHSPELACILFEVHDYENIGNDVLVAQYCLRVKTMKTGYRIVHLKNSSGDKIPSNLLIHILIK